jgi:uncharacterized protein (DUF697 family)/tellurite resistance protein
MTEAEQKAILTIALMAAFADGAKADAERDEVKRIAASLSAESAINVSALYQDVLLKRASLDAVVAALTTPELRQLAYELAVCVCDADGVRNDAERAYLAGLAAKLGIETGQAQTFADEADTLASVPLAVRSAVEPKLAATMSDAEMDGMILNYSILNGALELLPESLASMAIIPLQMKMVYRIGKAHGFELDRGHIKDFLATAGVGLTSQYVEQIGAKVVRKLLRAVGGRVLGGLGSQATSSAFSFASTYALGHIAKRYYAGGRSMSTQVLKDSFAAMLGEARSLQTRYLPEIQAKARTIDVKQILAEATR